jgi:polyhydroxybutyrate depolymerase
MKSILAIALLLLCISACRPMVGVQTDACAPGSYDEEIQVEGLARQYRLHIPPSYKANSPAPLLLGFHGAGSTGPQFESYTGFSALADRFGFIAVYPQGLGEMSNWDTMPQSTDIPFILNLIESLASRCEIDPARIYATGHSRGGGLVNRLGCELADTIAAIGPVAGDYGYSDTCSPSRAVPVVAFHGTADPYIPYNGFGLPGQIHQSYVRLGTPVTAWAAGWANRNGCNGLYEMTFQSVSVSGVTWSGCTGLADVILYTIQGGGHEWPVAVDASQMIWDFFADHSLPEE